MIKIFTLNILVYNIQDVLTLLSEKPVAKTVWSDKCFRDNLALNDCNWCNCVRLSYKCTARPCSNVDMFGHFNDAIQNMDVGMEGHGYWRSVSTHCDAGVHYQRDDLLCICTDEGKWPNPVCRDVFQILHTVEPTTFKDITNQTCEPSKLYQVECNVCLCQSTGKFDESACTKRNCSNDTAVSTNKDDTSKGEEIYGECERDQNYKIGCKDCLCLANNRLLCGNCTSVSNVTIKPEFRSSTDNISNSGNLCSNKTPGQRFKRDCNLCYCDQKDILYCTVLKCIESDTKIALPNIEFESGNMPVDDHDCIPGTKYNRKCNICYCFKLDGIKYFGCTLNNCENGIAIKSDEDGCVEGTTYEKNCMICHCVNEKGEIKEFCKYNDKCKIEEKYSNKITKLDNMHGYCEPLHVYDQDCNKCRCLTDGKTVACTSKICSLDQSVSKPLIVEFIPFIQKKNICPKGHKYKVDCNLCECISNGNAICTTKSCNDNIVKLG